MDQMSGFTPIGKAGLSWLSLELVDGQASGQGVIRRGETKRITSVSHPSIGHSIRLIAHETPTAICACGSHLSFAECGMARAFAGSYLNSRLRRPPPTLRLTARLISPRLGSHPKPGRWDQRRVHVKAPYLALVRGLNFALRRHTRVVLSVGLLLMHEADDSSHLNPISST